MIHLLFFDTFVRHRMDALPFFFSDSIYRIHIYYYLYVLCTQEFFLYYTYYYIFVCEHIWNNDDNGIQ